MSTIPFEQMTDEEFLGGWLRSWLLLPHLGNVMPTKNHVKWSNLGQELIRRGFDVRQLREDWSPPKKTVRMAPALNKFIGTERYFITSDIFKDEESAKNSLGVYFIKWPASESMFVDVPVEENNG